MNRYSLILGLTMAAAGCDEAAPVRTPDDDGEEPPALPPSLVFERPKDDGTVPRVAGSAGPPLRIRVINSITHAPVAGIFVNWKAFTAGSSVGSDAVPTDQNGYSFTDFEVGTRTGYYVAQATLNQIVEDFFVPVVADAPFLMIGGGDATTSVNTLVFCVVRVQDQYGNNAANVAIDWTIVGDAAPKSETDSTQSDGKSYFFFDIGSTPGEVVATAQVQHSQIAPVSCRYAVQ